MIAYLIFLMVSLEFEESIQAVTTLRLYESAICQQYYHGPVDESKCKVGPVQQKLGRVRGWQGLFDAIPSKCRKFHRHCDTLTSPFPQLCCFLYPLDIWPIKRGRRLVLFFSELGEICCLGWILMTCELYSSPHFPAADGILS